MGVVAFIAETDGEERLAGGVVSEFKFPLPIRSPEPLSGTVPALERVLLPSERARGGSTPPASGVPLLTRNEGFELFGWR